MKKVKIILKKPHAIQIDMELVDFEDGRPTEWSQFSHSSDWEDLKAGIKGVAHKMALRALTGKTSREIILLKGKKETPTRITSNDLSFSVMYGLRQKLDPVVGEDGKQKTIDGLLVYREAPVATSTYVNDLAIIFAILFDEAPTVSEVKKLGSFTGILDLVKKYFNPSDALKFMDGFVELLVGPGAQGMYRGNPEADHNEKMIMLIAAGRVLNIKLGKYRSMITNYYENYK